METRCGSFTLLEPLATGGMAEVWRARHGKLPVAMKFVQLDARSKDLFADEVRSQAQLDHPHVTRVLDFGVLEKPLGDSLQAGTPWLALEFSSGGHLGEIVDGLHWPAIRAVTLTLLDALAYAHSHGVIHRDLKLPNVLLSGPDDARPGLKLADFGIAHQLTDERAEEYEERITGTVNAMAPEQCTGAFREYGPWTDVYALGCMIQRLTSGRWPFAGLRGRAALNAHITKPPPALVPRIAVPPGLDEWLRTAMNKRPGARFQTAADAAYALLQLPDVPDAPPPSHPAIVASQASVSSAFSVWAGVASTQGVPNRAPVAPFAPRWERPARPPPGVPLVDAGLELYPLRPWPAVAREGERSALWAHLGEVRASGSPRAVLLRGVDGTGVSHLGEWLVQHAESMGAAQGFSIRASADDAPTEALLGLLREVLHCQGLEGEGLHRVVESSLARFGTDEESLTELLVQLLASGGSHAVRRGALRRVLIDSTRGRAGILWVDDAQHCRDVISLISSSLRNAWQAPILFVLGVGETHSESLDALEAMDAVSTLQLGALDPGAMNRLLQVVLPMEAGLHAKVLEDAEGLPGRAALQLDGLVRRRKLQATPVGYAIAEGAFTRTTGLADAEEERVEDLVTSVPEGGETALERAAILGAWVAHAAWERVCDDPEGDRPAHEVPIAGTRVRFAVLAQLKRMDLVREEGDGFRFVKPAFRRAVLARMPYLRLESAHFAASRYLRTLEPTPDRVARRARHLRDAGLMEEALGLFLEVLGEGSRASESVVLCQEALDLLDTLGASASDVRCGEVRLARLNGLSARQAHQSALEAETLVADAATHGWPLIEAEAIALLGASVFLLGDRELALDLCEDSVAAARATGRPEALARVGQHVGNTLRLAGRARQAIALLEEVEALCAEHGMADRGLRLQAELAMAREQVGIPTSQARLVELIRATQSQGALFQQAALEVLAGEHARSSGDLTAAKRFYEASLQTNAMIGHRGTTPLANLATVALIQEDPRAARHWLDRAQREDAESPGGLWVAAFTAMELEWAVLMGDLQAARLRCIALGTQLRTQRHVPDIVDSMTRTIGRLHGTDPDLAKRVTVLMVEYNRIGEERTEGI